MSLKVGDRPVQTGEAPRWSPSSWTSKPINQDVKYEDKAGVSIAIQKLERLPPLVTPQEIIKLRNSLREVALGNAFLLHGGDCAELFDYCEQGMIESKVKLLLQMSLVLVYGAKKKVVRIARMAGQFAKPRSSPMETINGTTMSSFRGDILNSHEPTPEARNPNPARLVEAYFHSAATLNYLRAAISSGLADMHSPLDWGLGHVLDPSVKDQYQKIVHTITEWLEMMQTIGLSTGGGLETIDLFTSHEGLLLEYEQSLTRLCKHPPNTLPATSPPQKSQLNGPSHPSALPQSSGFYDTSAHFLWIGDRTRQLTHAHVEFFRGISNPIGIKVGPTMPASDLPSLLDLLNPHHEIGKITLITRYGCDKIATHLPAHIEAVKKSGHVVVWQCDPMHGNGRNADITSKSDDPSSSTTTTTTIKTRHFSDILSELRQALQIHKAHSSYLGGVHLELTGDAVTECVGGAGGLTEQDLSLNYTTFCDPRLNEKQALELAFLVAGFYRRDGVAG
jgi:3-deoxy-7-phosphoheptulonate synthase